MRGLGKRLAAIVLVFLTLLRPAAADEAVVAILGDSLTAGYGLAPEAGLVPRLQAWLAREGLLVRLVNAGVSGDTTAGGLARLDWTLTPEVDALVVALGGNDMLRGLDPAMVRGNLAAILKGAADRGMPVLLVGFQAPGNWGPEYKEDFDAIYPELAAQTGALLMPSFFAPLTDDGSAAAAIEYLQADDIHPNPVGVEKVVAAMGPYVLDLVGRIE